MKLEDIRPLAEKFVETIRPDCKRIEIAGSIRREKPDCKDIEIVCIPEHLIYRNIFGAEISRSNLVFIKLRSKRQNPKAGFDIIKGSGGCPKYVQLQVHNGPKIDIFFATPGDWGWIFFLRTGPKEWNIQAVQRLKEQGYRLENGHIWRYGHRLFVEQESDVFRLLAWDWVEPKDRY